MKKLFLVVMSLFSFLNLVQADYVLSDNNLGFLLDGATPKIVTGATYQWLTGDGTNTRGNTNPGMISHDSGSELIDGVGCSGGGAYMVDSGWADAPTAATAQFDLKSSYSISKVVLNLDWKTGDGTAPATWPSISCFEVWTSEDGFDFTLWSEWDGVEPAVNRDATIELVADPVSARYVQVYTCRGAYKQALGEVVIYGDNATSAFATKLLSDNKTGGASDLFDDPTLKAINTGAIYKWLTTEGFAIQPTNSQVVEKDADLVKMTDGISCSGGGVYSVYSSWDGPRYATSMFDLNSHCLITKAELNAGFLNTQTTHNCGVGHLEVWVSNSDDPNDPFTLFGTWEGPTPVADTNAEILTVTGTPSMARYVQFCASRVHVDGNPWGHTWFHQMQLGEMAIYGTKTASNCEEVLALGKRLNGDINGDCYVDSLDLFMIAQDWLEDKGPNSSSVVDTQGSIFGAAGHMIHTDLFGSQWDSSWRVENTLPWLVDANLGWIREAVYMSWFTNEEGSLNVRTTELVETYLDYYESRGVKVILAPMFGVNVDNQFNAFFNWLAQLASKYNCVVAIEMGNEPNLDDFWAGTVQQYVDCCAAAYSIIHTASPETDVIAGAFSGWGSIWGDTELSCDASDNACLETKWAQECLSKGVLNYCDAVSAHPYRANHTFPEGGIGWESVSSITGFEDEIDNWWALVQSYNTTGKPLKVYFTEVGYSSAADGHSAVGTEAVKADFLSRVMFIVLNARVEGLPLESVNWYDLKKDFGVSDYEANFGLISSDNTAATQAYDYFARIAKTFNNADDLNESQVSVSFDSNPSSVKSYAWLNVDAKLIIPFWRANTISNPGTDFISNIQINGVSNSVSRIKLYDCSTDLVEDVNFTQAGSSLSLSATVKSNVCWLTIEF